MTMDEDKSDGGPLRKARAGWARWSWVVLPLIGGALLVPWESDWPRVVALVPLWAMAGLFLIVQVSIYGFYAYASRSPARKTNDLRWTRRRDADSLERLLSRAAFILGLIIAPLVAGHIYLAGCFAISLMVSFGLPDGEVQDVERNPDRPRQIGRAIFWGTYGFLWLIGWGISAVGRTTFMLIVWGVETVSAPFERWSNRRLARRLRSELDVPGGAVYFVYAEQHQFDRFLGPGGVLQEAIGGVVARHWRDDIQPGLGARSKTPLAEPERSLLRRFRVSNMREHLPFAVVIGADDRLHPFFMSQPYRKRARDGGAALADMERRLRLFIAVAD